MKTAASLLAVAGILASAGAQAAPRWRLVTPQNPARAPFIAAYSVTSDFGAVADGATDNTSRFQAALDAASKAGGGVVYVPAGRYVVRGQLKIATGVCLRGEWTQPAAGAPAAGTILMAYAGRGQDDAPRDNPEQPGHVSSFITVRSSGCLRDITIWRPEQTAGHVAAYPADVLLVGGYASVEDVTFVNAWRAVACARDNDQSCFNLRNLFGTALSVGVEIDAVTDVGRLRHLSFSPRYWVDSGLPGRPTTLAAATALTSGHAIGVMMRQNDWSYANNISVDGYAIGFQTDAGIPNPGAVPNGYCDYMTFTRCGVGIKAVKSWEQYTHVTTTGCRIGLQCDSTYDGLVKMRACNLSGVLAAIQNDGAGRLQFQQCRIASLISLSAGYMTMVDCRDSSPAPQINLAPAVGGVSLVGNAFSQPRQILSAGAAAIAVSNSAHPSATLPRVSEKDAAAYHPAKSRLYVVTEAPYGAMANASTDDTAAIQSALDAAGAHGGGVVFLPSGEYAVRGRLRVPTGVELRGAQDWPHATLHTGAILDLYAGRDDANGAATLTLAPRSGVRGLTCVYPEHRMEEIHAYAYLVRLTGADCYVCDLAALNPFQLIDAASKRCDRHYIARITGAVLRSNIKVGGGSVGGWIEDCQQNPFSIVTGQEGQRGGWTFSPVGGSPVAGGVYKYNWDHLENFVLEDCQNETLFNNFCFGGHAGLILGASGASGAAPSGVSFGTAFDQNVQDLHVNRIAAAGFPIVNAQYCTAQNQDYPECCYVYLAPTVKGNVSIEQSDVFGNPRRSFVVEGGNLLLNNTSIRDPGPQAFDVSAGSLRASGLFYRQYAPIGSPATLSRVTLSGAILPHALKSLPESSDWDAGVYLHD